MILLSIQFFPSKIQNLSLRFLFKLLWYNFPLFKIMVWSSWHHIYRSNIMFVTTWLKQRLIYLLSVFHDVYMYIFLVKLKSLTVITKKKGKISWNVLRMGSITVQDYNTSNRFTKFHHKNNISFHYDLTTRPLTHTQTHICW